MKIIKLAMILITFTLFFTSCDFKYPRTEFETLEQEAKSLGEQNMELRTQIRELNSQVDKLKEDKEATTVLAQEDDPYDLQVLEDLLSRTDLAPLSDDGEKMVFVPELCKVLGEQYVYAYAKTERSAADLLFSFKKESDGTFEWTPELCNKGSGWLPLNDSQAAIQGIQTLEPKDSKEEGVLTDESTGEKTDSSVSETADSSSSATSAPTSDVSSQDEGLEGTLWTGYNKAPPPTELEQETFKNIADLVN